MEKENKIKWTEQRMQYALTRMGNLFSFRKYIVVTGVGWGLGLRHTIDLLCLSSSNIFHEVEIKISIKDLKAEKRKRHNHYHKNIKHLWFAVPNTLDLQKVQELIPVYAGLVCVSSYCVSKGQCLYTTKIICKPKPSKRLGEFLNPTSQFINKFLRLGVMRYWTSQNFRRFDIWR